VLAQCHHSKLDEGCQQKSLSLHSDLRDALLTELQCLKCPRERRRIADYSDDNAALRSCQVALIPQ